ncbi:MAG: site-specific DNA-methyltransferase [Acidimicrobiales bacterium]|nr:site-specific DNA-methyltransferase [Acidimicrobiales bacterium]MYD83906.1 site-specific DNA-methyltransferase [Acidimicrobiales bacterium]MYJ65114.1 site-specific DNA-methyltransferase [Acidimicrobiales bacterium]
MVAPNWANRTLFHADNLAVMRGMNSETVDLIATDPPFNKGKDFHATPDSLAAGAKFQDRWSWQRDVHEEWTDQIADDYPKLMEAIESARYAHSDGMGAFMCFMSVRLLEMQRLLKPTGSLYLHCDPTASHYLKACMDAIFGYRHFRNEIVWFYPDSPGRPRRDFARKHDIILRYAKSDDWVFNADDVRVPILDASKDRYKTPRVIGGRSYTGGEAADIGKIPETVWRMPVVKQNSKQAYGYPTQKPLPLYERIIAASTPPAALCSTRSAGVPPPL